MSVGAASPTAETNRDRINRVRRSLPPAEGVKSRDGYASYEELARLLGAERSLVMTWVRKTKPATPSPKHAKRLAELSDGVYSADDFRRAETDETAERLARLETQVAEALEILRELRPVNGAVRAKA